MAQARQRADVLVVQQGLAPTRAKAQALILAGAIVDRTAERVVDKAGTQLPEGNVLALRHAPLPFVSRGGLKLQAALDAFHVAVEGMHCLDVGASTGGFTDCLLQRGAAAVVALDVGHNQLAYSLRQDPRVLVREHCNVRHAPQDCVPWPVQRVTIDVSFISLRQVLPALPKWLAPGAILVALVKPQFEVGRADVGKGGIVTDPKARARALAEAEACARAVGFRLEGSIPSPITGAKGNQEYLMVVHYEGEA